MVGNTACCNFHPYSWFAKHELDALHNNMKVFLGTKKIYISVISGHHRFVIIKELILHSDTVSNVLVMLFDALNMYGEGMTH